MVRVLQDAGSKVTAFDIKRYRREYGVKDFLKYEGRSYEWIITNPPYRHSDKFFHMARKNSTHGVALLLRLSWLQGRNRWKKIFSIYPPSAVGILNERMPGVHGKVVSKGLTFFQHCWVIWDWKDLAVNGSEHPPAIYWTPPGCQESLERAGDYR